MATEIKKFLDQGGVSTLWGKIATNLKAEEDRAKAAEAAALKAAQDAQKEVDALETYVGVIPSDEAYADITNIVAFIQKRAQEVLSQAQGGSSETAASVKAALDTYKAENDPKVTENAENIATILGDYLKKADKDELAGDIADNAAEILRIDNALKAAIENDGEGLDSIKELATWIETHGTEAAGYSAAISALEALVGDTAVATQIVNAINALDVNLVEAGTGEVIGSVEQVDGKIVVNKKTLTKADIPTIEMNQVNGLDTAISDAESRAKAYAAQEGSAAKGMATAARTAADNAFAEAEKQGALAKQYADSLAVNYDAAGSAADALASAKSYTDEEVAKIQALSEAEILAAINGSAQG